MAANDGALTFESRDTLLRYLEYIAYFGLDTLL